MGDRNGLVSERGRPPVDGRPRRSDAGVCSALPLDRSRLSMMRRQSELPLAERIALFEALSADAAWARRAVRIR
jgi:hypothetical protein